jgi:hypothetical protein
MPWKETKNMSQMKLNRADRRKAKNLKSDGTYGKHRDGALSASENARRRRKAGAKTWSRADQRERV